jgi:hypothetical protein
MKQLSYLVNFLLSWVLWHQLEMTSMKGEAVVGRSKMPSRTSKPVEFTECTPDNHLRNASFSGMRINKEPRGIVGE